MNGDHYSLHGVIERVERMGDRLAAPLIVASGRTEIVNLHDDGVPPRARVSGCVRVIVRRYLKAAAASSTGSTVCAECELVHRGGVPAHSLTTRCRRTSRSAWA